MGLFAFNMAAAEAVTLVEKLPLEVLELNLVRETTRLSVVESSLISTTVNAEYVRRVTEHAEFFIPLLEHAIKAKTGDIESQRWLDSLKLS